MIMERKRNVAGQGHIVRKRADGLKKEMVERVHRQLVRSEGRPT